ncbi:MAG: hypothetical protein MUF04_02310 [Akkermansiaceae bacterium]|jgi:hypothetical protein|nr:hypothetical protein [Akkermansiaceae bacterium]
MLRYLLLCSAAFPATAGAITIALEPLDQGAGGVGGSGLSSSQWAALQSAAAEWERDLPAYQSGITRGGVTVYAGASSFDGAGGTYAEATVLDTSFEAGFFLATAARVFLDAADAGSLEGARLLQTVWRHELGHALGFGTLWEFNGLVSAGTGRYYGPAGVAAFRAEFLAGASYVPVELGGGPATRDLHWNEVDQGAGLTGITDSLGRDFGHDLMSGWTGPDPSKIFLSNTTLRSFEDLGFTVVPEPKLSFCIISTLMLALRRSNRPSRAKNIRKNPLAKRRSFASLAPQYFAIPHATPISRLFLNSKS